MNAAVNAVVRPEDWPFRVVESNARSGAPVTCNIIDLDEQCASFAHEYRSLSLWMTLSGRSVITDGHSNSMLAVEQNQLGIIFPGTWRGAWQGSHRSLWVEIPDTVCNDVVGDDVGFPESRGIFYVQDPQFLHAMLAIKEDLIAGCPAGPLFSEHVGRAITAYIMQKYFALRTAPVRGGLVPRDLRRTRDLMEARLATSVSLRELADNVQLSVAHFSHLFRLSTGTPPHKYFLRLRIDRAMALLTGSDISLGELADQLGFCDQSQFTNVFRNHVGMTPARYRRQARQ